MKPVEKENVKKNQTSCPDCGHAIVWRSSRNQMRHFAGASAKRCVPGIGTIYEWNKDLT